MVYNKCITINVSGLLVIALGPTDFETTLEMSCQKKKIFIEQ